MYVRGTLRADISEWAKDSHMPITELKKLNFLLRFRERDLAALCRRRKPDADAIALAEVAIARLRAEIARLTDSQPLPFHGAVAFALGKSQDSGLASRFHDAQYNSLSGRIKGDC